MWTLTKVTTPVHLDTYAKNKARAISTITDMGMLTFASGSHNTKLPEIPISDESEAVISGFVKENDFPVVRQRTMKAGDATFHLGWLAHCAPGNASVTPREVMTVIYMDADATVTTPAHEHQEADRMRWLCGLPAGQPAASELNPVIYETK